MKTHRTRIISESNWKWLVTFDGLVLPFALRSPPLSQVTPDRSSLQSIRSWRERSWCVIANLSNDRDARKYNWCNGQNRRIDSLSIDCLFSPLQAIWRRTCWRDATWSTRRAAKIPTKSPAAVWRPSPWTWPRRSPTSPIWNTSTGTYPFLASFWCLRVCVSERERERERQKTGRHSPKSL